MTRALEAAVLEASKLPPVEQDILASFLMEEMASEARWTASFAESADLLGALAAEAIAESKAGKTRPLQASL